MISLWTLLFACVVVASNGAILQRHGFAAPADQADLEAKQAKFINAIMSLRNTPTLHLKNTKSAELHIPLPTKKPCHSEKLEQTLQLLTEILGATKIDSVVKKEPANENELPIVDENSQINDLETPEEEHLPEERPDSQEKSNEVIADDQELESGNILVETASQLDSQVDQDIDSVESKESDPTTEEETECNQLGECNDSDLIEDSIEESFEDSTEESFEDSTEESFDDSTEDSIEDSISDSIEEPIENSTEESFEGSTEESIDDSTEESFDDLTAGPIDDSTEEVINDTPEAVIEDTAEGAIDDDTEESKDDSTDDSICDSTEEEASESQEGECSNETESDVNCENCQEECTEDSTEEETDSGNEEIVEETADTTNEHPTVGDSAVTAEETENVSPEIEETTEDDAKEPTSEVATVAESEKKDYDDLIKDEQNQCGCKTPDIPEYDIEEPEPTQLPEPELPCEEKVRRFLMSLQPNLFDSKLPYEDTYDELRRNDQASPFSPGFLPGLIKQTLKSADSKQPWVPELPPKENQRYMGESWNIPYSRPPPYGHNLGYSPYHYGRGQYQKFRPYQPHYMNY